MATDIKISAMPKASKVSGDELVPVVQTGANKTVTISQIKEGLATSSELADKVDKDGDKVLSEKNFTAALESKLNGIEAQANKYTHPTTTGNKHIPSGGSSGQFLGWSEDGTAKWVAAPTYTITQASSSALGGVKIGYSTNGKNYAVQLDGEGKAFVNVPWANTTYSAATTEALGLVKQAAAIEDSAGGDEKDKINEILTALRTAGIVASSAAAASMMRSAPAPEIIDFKPPMILEKGQYYRENGIVYECIQSSKLSVSNKLRDLVGFYVKTVEV